MKKINCILLFLLVMSTTGVVKAQAYEKGTNVVTAGIGLGSSLLNYSGSNPTPAISAQYEKGIWETGPGVISLGGYIGYKGYKYSDKSLSYSEKWRYTIVGIRGAYHYTGFNSGADGLRKLDLYGGVMLSYNILKYKYTDNGAYTGTYNTGNYGSAAGFTGYVGGRYSVSKNIAAMAELGYGVSYLTLGLAFKF